MRRERGNLHPPRLHHTPRNVCAERLRAPPPKQRAIYTHTHCRPALYIAPPPTGASQETTNYFGQSCHYRASSASL